MEELSLGPLSDWVALALALAVGGMLFLATRRWLRNQRRIQSVATDWQLTIDAVTDPILTLDPDGRVLRMNQAAMQLSGRSYRENLGRKISELGTGEPWQTASQRFSDSSRATSSVGSGPVEDPESATSWEVNVSPVPRPGRARPKTIVVARNVTELVALQESLHRQELVSAMGSLVAGVSHDLRNYLVTINGTIQMIERQLGDDAPQLLKLVREQGDRMKALMQTLLDYGKPMELARKSESIDSLVQEAFQVCAAAAQDRNVELIRLPSDVPQVSCDRTRILQALTNLIENAIQYSPGGHVRVELLRVGRWVECQIRDSGPGIKQADLKRIFEPFFTQRADGTGLGLAIVHRAVSEHGGEIEVDNHPEGGAFFRIRLPADND